jgi:hypothetical protein
MYHPVIVMGPNLGRAVRIQARTRDEIGNT